MGGRRAEEGQDKWKRGPGGGGKAVGTDTRGRQQTFKGTDVLRDGCWEGERGGGVVPGGGSGSCNNAGPAHQHLLAVAVAATPWPWPWHLASASMLQRHLHTHGLLLHTPLRHHFHLCPGDDVLPTSNERATTGPSETSLAPMLDT